MTSTTGYAALYCRLSPRPDGSYEGVPAQAEWGRAYAAKTWPGVPVRVFSDAGISAANGDRRPAYEALREAIAAGEVACLWSVEQTRLERREVEWFTLAAELDAAGIAELHTNRDGVVRVRDEVSGIKAVLAAAEVRKLKRRVNDKLDKIAAEGRPSGAQVYGYRRGTDETGRKTLVVVEDEAATVRDVAAKVIAGWSLSRIAADLREQGLHGAHRRKVRDEAGEVRLDEAGQPVTRPTAITGTTVRKMVTNPVIAGWRVHRGVTLRRGVWPPILDEATWNVVRDKLAAPRTVERVDGGTYPVPGVHGSTARRYLLTGGVATCGVCGAPLVAQMKQLSRKLANGTRVLWKVAPYYGCHPKVGGKACVGLMGDPLEEYVTTRVLDELDKPAFREALAVDSHDDERERVTTKLRAAEGRRKRLASQWGAGDLTDEEWDAARVALDSTERALRIALAAIPPAVAHVDPGLIRDGWSAMNLDERREIVGMFVAKVVISRATPGTRFFDDRRVAIEWRRR